jgi:hypothetical protein
LTTAANPDGRFWRGTLGNTEVVVKFCKRYGTEATDCQVAGTGLAPRHRHFGRIEGGKYIVVMGFMQGADMYNYF